MLPPLERQVVPDIQINDRRRVGHDDLALGVRAAAALDRQPTLDDLDRALTVYNAAQGV